MTKKTTWRTIRQADLSRTQNPDEIVRNTARLLKEQNSARLWDIQNYVNDNTFRGGAPPKTIGQIVEDSKKKLREYGIDVR
jgi:hypothetical protein